jgi:putative spermidine/putrescine transport system substrate-binding protein
MADGVPGSEVYQVLGTEEGLQRAFAKLASIKDHVIFWESNAQAPQLLADKEVAIAQIFNGRMYSAVVEDKQPFVAIWDRQVYAPNTWIIPKGANKEAAMRLLKWVMQPERLAKFANLMPYAPARLSAVQYVDKTMVPHLPTAPDNYQGAIGSNEEWWADHEEEIGERFSEWLAGQ